MINQITAHMIQRSLLTGKAESASAIIFVATTNGHCDIRNKPRKGQYLKKIIIQKRKRPSLNLSKRLL